MANYTDNYMLTVVIALLIPQKKRTFADGSEFKYKSII